MLKKFFCYTLLMFSIIATLLPGLVSAHDGIYITASTGWAGKTGLPGKDAVGAVELSKQDAPVWKASVGYLHDIRPWFGLGLEAGLGGYGQYVYRFAHGEPATLLSTTTEFFFNTVFHHQLFDYIVKFGGIRNTMDIHYVKASSETRIQPELALGVAYTIRPHIALLGQYAHVFGGKITSLVKPGWNSPSLNEALLGFRVTFY